MASFNKVLLMGNLTRDPQLSYLPSQMPVVEFGLAVNERRKQQDGSYKDFPCFVDCQLFGKRAEVVNKYFKKGEPIFVEGRLKFDSWQAQDGSKRSKHRIFVENFEFVGKGGAQGGGGNSSAPQSQGYDAPPAAEAPYGGGGDDDIPF